MLYLLTPEGTTAAEHILDRPIVQESYSDICFDRAQRWIEECVEDHSETCLQFPPSLLSTRLVDVGLSTEPCQPRLHITEKGETGS